jgi:S-adenosylmethionine decarboxylase proenzyme
MVRVSGLGLLGGVLALFFCFLYIIMFSEIDATPGKQMICDIKNIENAVVLNNIVAIEAILSKICNTYDYTVISKSSHLFDGCGFTILWMLSESHLSVHTFPERDFLAFDIYTCRRYSDNTVYDEIYRLLNAELGASGSHYTIIDRQFS